MRDDDRDRISRAAELQVKQQSAAERGREYVGYEVGLIDQVALSSAVRRKLAGKSKPREEVLQAYEEANADRRSRIEQKFGHGTHVLWQFWAPNPDEMFRWRVELDCGCIHDDLSRSEDRPPHEARWLDPVNRVWLPAGQVWCVCDTTRSAPKPYRRIAVWEERREETFPADPVELPDYLSSEETHVWAKIRHDEPHSTAFWRVTLSCGHVDDHAVTAIDWKPEDGPWRMAADSPRLREMEQWWLSEERDSEERDPELWEHYLRMIAEGWPIPQTEKDCFVCKHARRVVAYEPIGPLVPKPKLPKPPRKPSRESLERRLAQVQAEAEKLQEQLAADDESAR